MGVLKKILAPFLCVGMAVSFRVSAQSPEVTEYEVKAVFLSHFAEFIEWPRERFYSPKDPIMIGILGRDPFGEILDRAVSGIMVKERFLRVERIGLGEVPRCHILFIGASEEGRLAGILRSLEGQAVLTVSDIEGFGDQGGMIHLVLVGKKVRFAVNKRAAERAGLTISSQLLKLAVRVWD